MKVKHVIVATAGVLLGAAFALVEFRDAAALSALAIPDLPDALVAAAPWAWKIVTGLVVLYVAWCLRPVRRGARSAATGSITPVLGPPPDLKRRGPVPRMPAAFLAHPFAGFAFFTGRTGQRAALTEWYKGKRSSPVQAMVAGAGVGKSTLAWVWLNRDVLDQALPGVEPDPPDVRKACRLTPGSRPQGALWWSFDRPGAGFSVFLDEALTYLTGGAVRPGNYLSSRSQKVDNLLSLLAEGRHLFVLDGFERELRAFARLDAAYDDSDHADDDRSDERLCADLHAAEFLRRLATQKTESRVLILSRLLPAELLEPACEELGDLEPGEAVALMQRCGIEGEDADLEAACAEYDDEALSLRLLAGVLRGPGATGRIRDARKVRGDIIDEALSAVDGQKQSLISHLAVLRGPVTFEQAAMFNPYGDDARLRDTCEELVARGLLLFDEPTSTWDMHQLVRARAYGRLPDRGQVHAHLAEYFAQVRLPGQLHGIEELQPAVEQYHHLVGAGRYEEAYHLLSGRFMTTLRDRFGDQQLLMQLLSGLFDGERPRLKQRSDRALALVALARACSYSGETRRAVALCEANLPSLESKKDEALTMLLGMLAGVQTRLGCLAAAEDTLNRLVELTGTLEISAEEAVARNRLGLLLATRGAFDEAETQLDKAFEIVGEAVDRQIQSVCFSYYTQRALLMNDAAAALDAAKKSRAFVEEVARRSEPDDHDYVRSGWLLAASYVAMAAEAPGDAASHLAEAERYLTDALSRCKRGDLVGFEPDLLLTSAKWHRASGKLAEAARIAGDAMSIAMRCEYRLKRAEGLNFMARLAQDAGDANNARKSAEMARDAAGCDGPPHCYQPALDEAEAILAELDGRTPERPEPELVETEQGETEPQSTSEAA